MPEDPVDPVDPVVKVDNQLPAEPYTPPDIDMTKAIPPDFRDKPYFKDKSFSDLVKDHVNLQTLLGQRPAGIPKDDSPPEEWDKFIGAIKPKSADEYAFPETEFSKAGKRNEGYEKAIRDMAVEVGVPKRQFGKFVEKIEHHLAEADKIGSTQSEEAKAAREAEFETLLDTTYKQDKQAVIDRTKRLMTESVGEGMKEKVADVLKDISNEHLFALTAVLDGVYKKYIAEDSPPAGDGGTGGDVASLKAEAEKIMMSPEYSDFRRAGHDSAKAKVQDLFRQIAGFQKS